MTHLHFTRRSPFSRQKSSLNGPDTAWAEGRYNTHPQHHCRSRGACTAHIVHKWSPHSRYNQAWPPWPVCSIGSTHQIHDSIWPSKLCQAPKLCSAPLSADRASPLLQSPEGAAWPFALSVWLTTMELACLLASRLSPVHGHGRLEGETQALAPMLLPKVTVWASNQPWQKTYWLAVLTAMDKSYKSDSQNFHFRKGLLGLYDGTLELTVSVLLIHQLLDSL